MLESRRKLLVVSSIVYRAVIDLFRGMPAHVSSDGPQSTELFPSRLPLSLASSIKKIDAGMRVTDSEEVPADELILGTIPLSDMSLLSSDPNGLSTVKEYISKLVDCIYEYAHISYEERKKMTLVSRLALRRKMSDRLSRVMPDYTEKLKRDEAAVLQQHCIPVQEVEKLVLHSNSASALNLSRRE